MKETKATDMGKLTNWEAKGSFRSLKQREFDTREIGKALATGEYDGSFVRSFIFILIDWLIFISQVFFSNQRALWWCWFKILAVS